MLSRHTRRALTSFSDPRTAYASKSTLDLFRGLLVLNACRGPLVRRADTFLAVGNAVSPALVNAIVRHTFFKHFCAGETEAQARETFAKLKEFNVGGILDFAAEGDVVKKKKGEKKMEEKKSEEKKSEEKKSEEKNEGKIENLSTNDDAKRGVLSFAAEGDVEKKKKGEDENGVGEGNPSKGNERAVLDSALEGNVVKKSEKKHEEKIVSLSREYEYESERVCDSHMRDFQACVKAAGDGGFAAVKVTALGDAEMIKKIAACVLEIKLLFAKFAEDSHHSGKNSVKVLTRGNFAKGYEAHFVDGHEAGEKMYDGIMKSARERFASDEKSLDEEVDLLEWSSFVTPRKFVELSKKLKTPPHFGEWTSEDSDKMDQTFGRLVQIAETAVEQNVRIFLDAEHTYFQPAIDAFTLKLQRQYNDQNCAVVFATYQAYLKDAQDHLAFALKSAEREHWRFACKIVRGAYMVRERSLAEEMGVPSPIQDTLQDTAESYRKCCELVLKASCSTGADLVVASHNAESIEAILKMMDHLGLKRGSVSFAQLLGMADGVSFGLAKDGHSVYKYLPFGPVNKVLPYLIRRAQENSIVVDGSARERKMMWAEIRRRTFG